MPSKRKETELVEKDKIASITNFDPKDQKSNFVIDHENKYFKVKRTRYRNPVTGEIETWTATIIFKSQDLWNDVSTYGIYSYDVIRVMLGKDKHVIQASTLLNKYEVIMKQRDHSDELKSLMEWASEEMYKKEIEAKDLIKKGKITFETLQYLFKPGAKIVGKLQGQLQGALVRATRNEGSFIVDSKIVKTTGKYFYESAITWEVPFFEGLRAIEDLPVQPLTNKDTIKQLKRRGKLFSTCGVGNKYMEYKGHLIHKGDWGPKLLRADGRIMIDITTFIRMNPNNAGRYQDLVNQNQQQQYQQQHQQQFNTKRKMKVQRPRQIKKEVSFRDDFECYSDSFSCDYESSYEEMSDSLECESETEAEIDQLMNEKQMKKLNKKQYFMSSPSVAGFSFSLKIWGEVLLDNLSDVKYDDDAFDTLVLDQKKKNLVQALVDQHAKSKNDQFADFITNKGAGLIFLLHGPPGVGKTLTAEAVSERLHQPMYNVSVGELGTTAAQLETSLQNILELASIWKCVILINEADIFLEQRVGTDIVRNAMIAIFLRLLEYHQGVLFLTTNRIRAFDFAFHSRISVALKYEDLTEEARAQIWQNFMSQMKIKNVDASQFSTMKLNGREIRNILQVTQALVFSTSRKKKQKITAEDISRTIRLSFQMNVEETVLD